MLKRESQYKIFSLRLIFSLQKQKNADVYIIFFYILKVKNGMFFCKPHMIVFIGCLDLNEYLTPCYVNLSF